MSYISYVMIDNPLTSKTMNTLRFDRHELFTQDWMMYHQTTLRSVEDFFLDTDETPFNRLTNMLNGVWDGYLYTEMLEIAKQMGLPTHLLQRIANTIQFIGTNINSNTKPLI